jgi:hypothetical protein
MHRPRRVVLVLVVLLAVVGLFAATAFGHAQAAPVSPGPWCGGLTWRLMNLSDRDREDVRFDRTPTTIAAIAKLQPPQVIGLHRTSSFARHTWRLQAIVDRYRIASNGEIVLVLYEIPSGRYIDAYLPNPDCLGLRSRDRSGMEAARSAFTRRCPPPTAQWQLLGATVDVSGVGFWNTVRTTRGALPNGAELRPLTNLSIVVGCGIGKG